MFFFKLLVSFPVRKAKDVLISEKDIPIKDIPNVLVGTSFVIFIFFPFIIFDYDVKLLQSLPLYNYYTFDIFLLLDE